MAPKTLSKVLERIHAEKVQEICFKRKRACVEIKAVGLLSKELGESVLRQSSYFVPNAIDADVIRGLEMHPQPTLDEFKLASLASLLDIESILYRGCHESTSKILQVLETHLRFASIRNINIPGFQSYCRAFLKLYLISDSANELESLKDRKKLRRAISDRCPTVWISQLRKSYGLTAQAKRLNDFLQPIVAKLYNKSHGQLVPTLQQMHTAESNSEDSELKTAAAITRVLQLEKAVYFGPHQASFPAVSTVLKYLFQRYEHWKIETVSCSEQSIFFEFCNLFVVLYLCSPNVEMLETLMTRTAVLKTCIFQQCKVTVQWNLEAISSQLKDVVVAEDWDLDLDFVVDFSLGTILKRAWHVQKKHTLLNVETVEVDENDSIFAKIQLLQLETVFPLSEFPLLVVRLTEKHFFPLMMKSFENSSQFDSFCQFCHYFSKLSVNVTTKQEKNALDCILAKVKKLEAVDQGKGFMYGIMKGFLFNFNSGPVLGIVLKRRWEDLELPEVEEVDVCNINVKSLYQMYCIGSKSKRKNSGRMMAEYRHLYSHDGDENLDQLVVATIQISTLRLRNVVFSNATRKICLSEILKLLEKLSQLAQKFQINQRNSAYLTFCQYYSRFYFHSREFKDTFQFDWISVLYFTNDDTDVV